MDFTRKALVVFRLSAVEKESLRELAKRQGVTLSNLIRQALLAYIEREAETLQK